MLISSLLNQRCRPTVVVVSVLSSTLFLFFYLEKYHGAAKMFQPNYRKQTPEDEWIPIENSVTTFSAFYDDRGFRRRPVLVVLGLQRQSDHSTPYICLVSYNYGKKVTLRDSFPLRVLTGVHWLDGAAKGGGRIPNYRPFSYECVLPTPEIPQRVTIISSAKHSRFQNHTENFTDSTKFSLVTNRKEIQQKFIFGVCVSSPIFKVDDPQLLVNYVEMNRLLGAEFFTAYIYQISGMPLEILSKYVKDGYAEVVTNWGTNFPGEAHYYGQLLSVTDCLYRNIYRVKYLVYADLDEVIVPLRHPSWGSLINDIDGPKTGSFNFEMVHLRKVQGPEMTHRLNCSSGVTVGLTPSRYATFRNRSVVVKFNSKRTKYIAKTNVTIIAQIHNAEKLVQGYVQVDVPVEVALLYHYRVPYLTTIQHAKVWVMDTVVTRYLSRLFTAVKFVLCSLS